MDATRLAARINQVGPWLKRRFGGPVTKIGLDAGLSCPHRSAQGGGCAFCPPSGSGRGQGGMSISQQLDQGLARLRQRAAQSGKEPPLALAYFQAFTATNAPAQVLGPIFRAALGKEGLAGMIISTRPDCLDQSIWDLISELASETFLWLELGLQSSHAGTLQAINRGHGPTVFDAAVAEAQRRDIPVVAHVILGLPAEEIEQTNATADHLAGLGVWGVKLHNLMVLEGAALAQDYVQGKLRLWSRNEWARAAAHFVARLPRAILVHRLAADPGRDTLIAPEWAGDKDANLSALADYMEQYNLEQGSLWPSPK